MSPDVRDEEASPDGEEFLDVKALVLRQLRLTYPTLNKKITESPLIKRDTATRIHIMGKVVLREIQEAGCLEPTEKVSAFLEAEVMIDHHIAGKTESYGSEYNFSLQKEIVCEAALLAAMHADGVLDAEQLQMLAERITESTSDVYTTKIEASGRFDLLPQLEASIQRLYERITHPVLAELPHTT